MDKDLELNSTDANVENSEQPTIQEVTPQDK